MAMARKMEWPHFECTIYGGLASYPVIISNPSNQRGNDRYMTGGPSLPKSGASDGFRFGNRVNPWGRHCRKIDWAPWRRDTPACVRVGPYLWGIPSWLLLVSVCFVYAGCRRVMKSLLAWNNHVCIDARCLQSSRWWYHFWNRKHH